MDEKRREQLNAAAARWRAKHPKHSTIHARRTNYAASKQWNKENREKVNQYRREWYKRNVEKARASSLEYAKRSRLSDLAGWRSKKRTALKAAKERKIGRPCPGACELCGNGFIKKPHADHDHATGKYRGWICRNCNVTLGTARENIALLQSMIDWIKNGGVRSKK
jgi:hypothetical protein